MFIDKVKTFLTRVKASLPGRWFWLLVGLGLIVNSIYLMHQHGVNNEVNQTLALWNEIYRLEINNILYFAVAIPYLLAGGLLSAYAFAPIWKKQEETQTRIENKETPNWAYFLPRMAVTTLLFAFLIIILAQHKYSPILVWMWIYILALQTFLFYRRENSIKANLSPNITRIDIWWMTGLFLAGLTIGAFALNDIPNIMVPDEGPFWETARAIAARDFKPDFFSSGVYTFPVASSIYQGWVMRLVGINMWGWRFSSVLAGTIAVIPLYLLAREWFDQRVAVMAGLLMLTSPYYLSFARLGYNNSLALFPVVLSLYFWSLGYKRTSSLYYWLAGLAAGLGFYTHPAAWLGLVTILIVMALLIVLRRINFRQALFALAIFLAAVMAIALPRIVYGTNGENSEAFFSKMVETSFISDFYGSAYYSPEELHPEDKTYLLGSNEIFCVPDVYAKLLTRSTVRTLAALFNPFIVTEHFMTTNFAGGFLPAIGLALGLSLSLRTIKQTRSILLLTWLGAGLFLLSIIAAFPPRHTHLVTIIPALALLSSIGFVASIDTFTNELQKIRKPALIAWGQIGLIVIIGGALVVGGVKQYFTVMPDRNPPLFEDIASWIAWRNDKPMTIVFVGAEADRSHRIQYHVETLMAPHKYINTTLADFNWKDVPSESIVFYEHQDEPIPPPPFQFNIAATYKNQNEAILGAAWANTNVDLQPTLPLSRTGRKNPYTSILLFSTLAVIVFAIFTLRIHLIAERGVDENTPSEESELKKENKTVKIKIDGLKLILREMALPRSEAGHSASSAPWWKKALFVLTVLISAIPVYFVVMDRWFEKPIYITAVEELWRSISALSEVGYPRYFLIIFCTTVITALIVFFWRKGPVLPLSNLILGKNAPFIDQVDKQQYRVGHYLLICALVITNISFGYMLLKGRIPGWELLLTLAVFISGQIIMEYPLEGIKQHFQGRGRILLDTAIFIIALCCQLYNTFGESKSNIIFLLLFVFAGINILRHKKEIPAIFWVSTVSLIALTWKINGWEYVVIGDEYNFYNEVRNILENRTTWELINNTFNGIFVYGTHPYFSSYVHYFFMKLFGNHNFGWRFSNPFLVASSLFFFYYFFKTFIPRRTALITVIIIGTSHYLLSFSKIGYNNLQALFALSLVLAAFVWALKAMNFTSFSMLGLSIGICFYIYPAALYIIPLPFLGMLIFLPPTNKDALKRWGWTIVSIVLLFYPLFSQPKYWVAKIAGTFFYTDVSNSAGALIKNLLLNTLYTSLSFLYIPEQTHYVSTGYMDPISSVFIVIGFACLVILAFRRNKSALFLALSFLWMFFIVGTTHGRNFPTATRMFLLLPWFALFTAFGLEWCAKKSAYLFIINRKRILSLVTILIVFINLYQTYVIDIRNMAQYHSLAPLFVKTVREINSNTQIPPKSYAFVAPPDWDVSGMAMIQRVYLVPDSARQLINLPLAGSQLPESEAELVKQRDVVIIVKGNMDSNILTQVGTQLQNWGKVMCEVRNGKGTLQFQLWHSGDLAWLCQ